MEMETIPSIFSALANKYKPYIVWVQTFNFTYELDFK